MPFRPFSRQNTWLFPPTLDELIPANHPVRFIAAIVESLDRAAWIKMGINPDGEVLGAAGYDPRVLLPVWLYGFMSGLRSARKLEEACWSQVPYMWLTGWQFPDHNTLWRFYRDHRKEMRKLLKGTVRIAVRVGLVELAVQAVDGSKVAGNASRYRSYDKVGLQKLLERTDEAIKDLEAQGATGGEASAPRLPEKLTEAQVLREQVQTALEQLTAEEDKQYINLTDGDAALVKTRQGIVAGYNAQAMVSPLKAEVAGKTGLFITAADVVNDPDDHEQLVPMMEQAQENTGQAAEVTLADGGYHSGENLEECEKRGKKVLMTEAQARELENPYHKDRFSYDAEANSYTCPEGQKLSFRGTRKRKKEEEVKVYRAMAKVCRACPAFGQCTKDERNGRAIEVSQHEDVLRRHRAVMSSPEAEEKYRLRKILPEPTFGIMKEAMGARRFLLRGLENVRAEWALLATAFNLRTLWRIWQGKAVEQRAQITGLLAT